MKTFFNLIQEVQERGLCHHCGGCVTFCTAVNYGALELDPDGRPQYRDRDKCIDCGLCYMICPEIHELDDEQKRLVSWSAPMGRILDVAIARASDPRVRERATDGGVVTALLLQLFDLGKTSLVHPHDCRTNDRPVLFRGDHRDRCPVYGDGGNPFWRHSGIFQAG
ncbi:MAG: 4Fe-4S dicluster domain-containing protein, partial [Syntrophobacteraceae bacterium]|nr:4Fe-4S dicluster domain-containing protein [Syntrophobacteraceae bacterium]